MNPGFVDLQVNGYAGVDFNSDELTVESIARACERLRADGVDAILATLITNDVDWLCRRLELFCHAISANPLTGAVIQGFHVEGPFLNPDSGYIGAHPVEHARPADLDSMRRMFDAACGLLRIVTLAPECDLGLLVTRWLKEQGVTVSAGHCNPSRDQLLAAIDAGLTMFTHLGNGCPLEQHRHDNIVQRVLSLADRLMIGFIADGVHVPFFALRNYIRLAGCDRVVVVTDAVAAAGQGPGIYQLGRQDVVVDENLATWNAAKTNLVGSAMTMSRVAENLRHHIGLTDAEIRAVTQDNPRRFLSLRAT